MNKFKGGKMKKVFGLLVVIALSIAGSGTAHALGSYLTTFETTYPYVKGKVIDTCGLCHINPAGGGTRNAFGNDFANNGHSFSAIQLLDSDLDKFSNIKEIKDLSFPGDATSKPQKPKVTAFTVAASATPLVVNITKFTATDNATVMGYLITETSTKPKAGAKGWSKTKPTTYTASTSGAKTLYAWAKDRAGLVSASKSAAVIVAMPGVTPAAPAAAAPSSTTMTTQAASSAASAGSLIPLPSAQESFTYDPVASPVRNADPAGALPIGVGAVATGGSTVGLQVSAGRFAGPVDVYLTLYTPAKAGGVTPESVYGLNPDNTFSPISSAAASQPWKKGVTDVNQQIPNISAADLPAGTYVVILAVTPAGNHSAYYNWITSFVVE